MSDFDPFDDDADETVETPVNDSPWTDAAPNTEVTVTLKAGADYAAPWVVLRAPDVPTARTLVEDTDNLHPLLEKTHEAGKHFASMGAVSTVKATAASAPASAPARPARQEAPGGEVRTCKHSEDFGPMQYRTGVTKTGPRAGEPWKAFMCPAPQGTPDQCKAQWVR